MEWIDTNPVISPRSFQILIPLVITPIILVIYGIGEEHEEGCKYFQYLSKKKMENKVREIVDSV
jgi:hypothetical protein